MRSGVRRDVTLVHGVATSEKHGERHWCPFETSPGRAAIFARIDVRFHYIAEVVHIIAKSGRDMVDIFPDHPVVARGSRKAGLAGGDG
jgi:hypothetical protein